MRAPRRSEPENESIYTGSLVRTIDHRWTLCICVEMANVRISNSLRWDASAHACNHDQILYMCI